MANMVRGFCRNLVNNRYFTLFVFFFVLLSVFFILIETILFSPDEFTWIHWLNDTIIIVFAIEPGIRWIAIGRFRDFIDDYRISEKERAIVISRVKPGV